MSQTVTALLGLRELILKGELPVGERVPELMMVERLAVSRTPIRAALARLAEEGLVRALPSGGYAVSGFSEAEIYDAIELRGTLEGLAARLAAERGAERGAIVELRALVAKMDPASAGGEADFTAYVSLNEYFHMLLVELAQSPVVAWQLGRTVSLPFASPSAFVQTQATLPQAQAVQQVAQEQHRAVIDAIEAREGTRAEALMREHARLARRNLQLALRVHGGLAHIPGGALIRTAGGRVGPCD